MVVSWYLGLLAHHLLLLFEEELLGLFAILSCIANCGGLSQARWRNI
jgi:hypothetical protein